MNLKNIAINKKNYFLSIIISIFIYLAMAILSSKNIDFIAINGTFQNYNVIRRLLNGQIPYKDFSVYLGLGHLYTGSLFTFIFGNTFSASVIVLKFLSSIVLIALAYGICKVVFDYNWIIPFLFINIFAYIENTQYNYIIHTAFTSGNSARFIRGAILPISIIIFCILYSLISKNKNEKKQKILCIAIASVVSSIALIWSNDYGISVWLCTYIMTLFIMIIRKYNFFNIIKNIGIILSGNILIISGIISIVTKGNLTLWLKKNFLSAGYQGWYYNDPDQKTYYLYEIDLSIPAILCMILFVYYSFMLIKNKATLYSCKRYGIFAFSTLCCLAATNEYKLLGGGNEGIPEVISIVTVSIIVCELISIFSMYLCNSDEVTKNKCIKILKPIYICSISILIVLNVISICFINSKIDMDESKDLQYVEKLGGNLYECYDNVMHAEEYIKDKTIFSIYASFSEIMNDTFQPTGIDYIIHCLTDEQREYYLDTFKKENPECVVTINENYTPHGYWIQNANWFFYREVYMNYHKQNNNTYSIFWEKNTSYDNNIYTDNIKIQNSKINEYTYSIDVQTDDSVNGIADVYIEYESYILKSPLSFLMHNNVVGISMPKQNNDENTLFSWALKPTSNEYIPVYIKNGKGHIEISSYPKGKTELSIIDLKCDKIFIDNYKLNNSF